MDSDLLILGEVLCTLTHTVKANLFFCGLTVLNSVEHPGKIQTQDQPEFFRNLQSLADCPIKYVNYM